MDVESGELGECGFAEKGRRERLFKKCPHSLSYNLPITIQSGFCALIKVNLLQEYQTVPETPLLSCRVLQEEQETWMDVQVMVNYCR